MGIVQTAHRHHYVPHFNVELRAETLLEPELLQGHFPALLGFALPLAGLFELLLHRSSAAAVLELYFSLHRPSLAEVVSYIYYRVRDVEPAVLLTGVRSRRRIPVNIVTVEIAGEGHFPISTQRKSLLPV